MTISAIRAGCFASLSIAALSAMPAYAQAAAASENTAAEPAAEEGLADIVVTAQKRSENLQNVPISVTAVTGEAVENLQATTLQGLQGTVPNIQINSFTNTPNNAVFTIRGIGIIEPDPFAGNTVSIVQDGVPQYFSMGALLDLFDVDRVEILRGPQGTLFGANTTGGVVNVVTRQPTGEFGGRAEVTVGNWGRLDAKAAFDFPIVEDLLAGKIAVMHHGRDGFYTNIMDGTDMGKRDVTALRGYLKLTPNPDLDVALSGEYGRTRNGSPVIVNGAVPGEVVFIPAGFQLPGQRLPMYQSPCVSRAEPCSAPDRYFSANSSVPDRSDMDTYRGTLTVNLSNTSLGDITAITGYKKFTLSEYTDNDATPLDLLDTYRVTKGWQLSQELRTSIDPSDNVNILLGGFYMKTHYNHFMNLLLEFAAPGFSQLNTQVQDNWSGSLFAQSYVNLSDKLRLQAGIRYTHEKTEMTAGNENFTNPDGPAIFFGATSLGGFLANGSKSWDKLGWKIGLDYQAQQGLLLYGYYARGFKSGGFVGRIQIAQDIGPFNPETVDTFEAGIKADLFDRRLRTNLAAFYTSYKDMQLAQNYFAIVGGTQVPSTTIFNAAKSEIKGFEFEATALPVDGLTLTGSLAYLDATYKNFDFFNPGTNTFDDLSGRQLQNSPKWSGTAGATYEFALASGTMKANVLYTYTSKKFLQGLTNAPTVEIQPTHYIHGNLSWTPESERWSVDLWVKNLADKRYLEAATLNPGLFAHAAYAPPREYGVSFRYNW
jgi:iron complex outermembrane recepter protein